MSTRKLGRERFAVCQVYRHPSYYGAVSLVQVQLRVPEIISGQHKSRGN
jgi:hypothetical protein